MSSYRDKSLASWEASATGWAYWSRHLFEAGRTVTDWLVHKVGAQPGQTILDLAAGTGDTGYQAARQLGTTGRLISTDFAPAMIEKAGGRAEELGLDNVEFRVMDAERMDLEDRSVDGVLCRYGYMLMADPRAAMRETRRVLRPGGRVAFATFTKPEQNPWALFGRVLVERGAVDPPAPGKPGIFGIPDRQHVERITTEAGFTETEVEALTFQWDFPDFDGYWDFVTTGAGAVATVVRDMAPDELTDYRRELAERVAPFAQGDGTLAFPACSLMAAAR